MKNEVVRRRVVMEREFSNRMDQRVLSRFRLADRVDNQHTAK